MRKGALAEYVRKRDFTKTSEPAGGKASKDVPIFCVQHHMATAEHYDFRLEIDGVLISWAVPKGPSYDPADKRLAMRTEDHPMDYATFEGTIPKGEYGGGTVMLWDLGVWQNISEDSRGRPISAAQAIHAGEIKAVLLGEKLKGGWVLVRTSRGAERERWIMIKHQDEYVGRDRGKDVSVKTGRTMAEIVLGRTPRTRNRGLRRSTKGPSTTR
jgi:bifunctional non-homologous end joining protein LigD